MIHYSLFPNESCVICGVKVLNNALHCKKCYKKWLELNEKKAVFKPYSVFGGLKSGFSGFSG